MKKTLYSLTLSEDVVRAVDSNGPSDGDEPVGIGNQILAV